MSAAPTPTVVIVPGFGGSVLRSRDHPGVRNTWLSPRLIATPREWLAVNRTVYDRGAAEFRSAGPVSEADFGGTSGVRDLVHPMLRGAKGQGYFGEMIDRLAAPAGGGSEARRVVSAPYDFRTVLNGRAEAYVRRLSCLIVESRPAVVVAHSMGAVLARAAVSQGRVADAVAGLVEICPGHGGCIASLEAMVEGSFYTPLPPPERRRVAEAARSTSGLVLTLPNPSGFGGGPVWVEPGGRAHRPGGPWCWPGVDDAWRHLALPLLASVSAVPARVPHTVVYSDQHDSPESVDAGDGNKTVVTARGDGVMTLDAMLCRVCDHTQLVRCGSTHRSAPLDPASIAAVRRAAAT
jgi:hypothetical protein